MQLDWMIMWSTHAVNSTKHFSRETWECAPTWYKTWALQYCNALLLLLPQLHSWGQQVQVLRRQRLFLAIPHSADCKYYLILTLYLSNITANDEPKLNFWVYIRHKCSVKFKCQTYRELQYQPQIQPKSQALYKISSQVWHLVKTILLGGCSSSRSDHSCYFCAIGNTDAGAWVIETRPWTKAMQPLTNSLRFHWLQLHSRGQWPSVLGSRSLFLSKEEVPVYSGVDLKRRAIFIWTHGIIVWCRKVPGNMLLVVKNCDALFSQSR